MLVQGFDCAPEKEKHEASRRIRSKYLPMLDTQVITGDESDGKEGDIFPECRGILIRDIRAFSYPNLLYKEVGSTLAHEYRLGMSVSSMPMADREANVSYVNTPGGRLIYFHFDWLLKLCRATAESAEKNCSSQPTERPRNWWLDAESK